ncbi:hypothetical protein M7775_17195 [Sporomusa sphaeroides DSM 2875]|uniref:helix-turn-helix domain-containing protein n=1 Tax=Sporomusa sphaeroides TaxID=47679 RepID=UPI00202F6574|nr:hypothetical protein [Sporomusa sphaeroides]MCM0760292.1 hypothetical protein [Sporomusa sphaeroides DSM 2875]
MKCPACGKTVERTKFCAHCGAKLPAAPRGRKANTELEPTVIKYIDKLAYSAAELALAIGVSRGKVYEWMDQSRISYVQVDGRKMIRRKTAEDFLAQHEVAATSEVPKLVRIV